MTRSAAASQPSSRRERLLEDHQIRFPIWIPADADDVILLGDRQVQHGPMLVVALEADRFVIVLLRPAMDGVHELRGNSLAAELGKDAVEPGEKNHRLKFKSKEKPHGAVADTPHHLQH